MTQKFSAADFANARFAEHESGQAIAIRWTKDYGSEPDDHWVYERPLNNRFSLEATHQEMSDMGGWVPVPTKPTITQSRFDGEFDPQWRWNVVEIQQKLEKLGIEIIPDPEPTDEELLAGIIRGIDDWQSITSPELLAKYLNTAGVTPPNVKGNTEKLEQLIRESDFKVSGFLGHPAFSSFAKYLNDHGVTAPNVKGN
jgi:hypothetical protein